MDEEELTLSAEDISHVLQNKYETSQEFKILSYKITPIAERNGLLGEHAILHVTCCPNKKAQDLTFFVKFLPKFAPSAAFALGVGAFKKEIFMYHLFGKFRQEINLLDVCVPKCYHTQCDRFLVMDDMNERGFERLNKHETLNYDSINVILQFLAKLHASSLIYEENLSKDKPYRLIEEYSNELEESFFNDKEDFVNLKGIQAAIKGIVSEIKLFDFSEKLRSGKSFTTVAEEVCLSIYKLVKPSKKFRNVISHGDLWTTNFLLQFDKNHKPTSCCFVDFQCGRYVPPAQDVMSLFYLNTSREFRKKHMYSLLGVYYTNLEKTMTFSGYKLDKLITFDEFLASCEVYKTFATIQAAIYFPLILISNDSLEKYFCDDELNRRALWEDRSLLVLEHMDKDENYKQRICESIQDLKDCCDYI